jgi:predicted type IV restriction endonuclease
MNPAESDIASLVQVINKLQQRMRRYDPYLYGSELLTRYILIDPLLRALGWDTEDPQKVWVDFRVDDGRKRSADYVLFSSKRMVTLIEAKSYGGTWTDGKFLNALYQVASYRVTSTETLGKVKVPLGIVTDGEGWYVYSLHSRSPIKRRRTILEFCLPPEGSPEEKVTEVAIKALDLSSTRITSLARKARKSGG